MLRRLVALATVTTFALTGCGVDASPGGGSTRSARSTGSTGSTGSAVTSSPGAACLTAPERAGGVRFRSDNGASIAGVLLGAGRVGVVLAHGNTTNLCDWVPYARVLAGQGYTAFPIDLNGYGASAASAGVPADPRYDADLSAAVKLLRGRGVDVVFLIGEVVGGTAAVKAATEITPPVAGVVDVSSPADTLRMDAVAAARVLTVPLLCVAADIDEFVFDVRRIADAATGAPEHRLLIVAGASSGETSLFDPALEPKAAEVRAEVTAFLRRHGGPS
jgi:pimeloyl-ACP methyl ester carboxylesterase